MNALLLKRLLPVKDITINLPASKSISNRALVLRALSANGGTISNLSDARDTQILYNLLESNELTWDVADAGTAMRFLCAYCCAANKERIITGTERMLNRPVKPLVQALQHIGFDISYTGADGFPPVHIKPIKDFTALKSEVSLQGNISSQFVSALLLIASVLPKGLVIKLIPPVASQPYIDMTLALLRQAGVKVSLADNVITVAPQPITQTHFNIEADWTNAIYWFSLCALLPGSSFVLNQLSLKTIQGDKTATDWMRLFGVDASAHKKGVQIKYEQFNIPSKVSLHFNFTHHPDLAQTFMVLCAAKGITSYFTGLESLRIKETDRIAAMQQELAKCNVQLTDEGNGTLKLSGSFKMPQESIHTYNDHRMAMAFAPLAALGNIEIETPWVVEKSYPTFWKELESVQ